MIAPQENNRPQGVDKAHPLRVRAFSKTSVTTLGVLVTALALCFVFQWTTRDAMANLPFVKGRGRTRALIDSQRTLVNLGPWKTAQELTPLAITAEEKEYAQQAQRLAGHEVDQAFAAALRQSSLKRRTLTGPALELQQKVTELQQTVTADQAAVKTLKATEKPADANNTATDDLDIAQAQLGLDQDQLDDAQQDLARMSGDERGRIQQELTAHQAEVKKADALTAAGAGDAQVATISTRRYLTLLGQLRAWFAQNSRYDQLQEAIAQSKTDAAALQAKHDAQETAVKTAAATAATGSRLEGLRRQAEQRQLLGIYDDRIDTQEQLQAVYTKWSAQVLLQHRILLHLLLLSLAWVLTVSILAIFANAIVVKLMERPTLDRRRARTLSTILRLGIQILALLVVLLIIFGPPSQVSTVVGLATAGLTVALQDFILAFVGWFLLMGRNGIRLGDTVEIAGVTGEVVEIGLFRTTLLETGNWTDKGHPTGRRVGFNNRYAISGQYFNFSTSGQWMWDEINVTVPQSEDTYAAIERIHEAVNTLTEKDADLAEAEWQRASRQNALSQFSAAPAVDVRPAASGLSLVVRYITRAASRYERKNQIFQSVMDAMREPAPPAASSVEST